VNKIAAAKEVRGGRANPDLRRGDIRFAVRGSGVFRDNEIRRQ
jgi:hypothetical protein